MTKQDWEDIIIFEVHNETEEKNLKRIHYTGKEYYRLLYKKALEKLEELSNED